MSATTSTITDDQPVPGLAEGHLIAYGHAFAAPGFGSYTAGDGGVVSTATEMARWLIVNANDGQAPTAPGSSPVTPCGSSTPRALLEATTPSDGAPDRNRPRRARTSRTGTGRHGKRGVHSVSQRRP